MFADLIGFGQIVLQLIGHFLNAIVATLQCQHGKFITANSARKSELRKLSRNTSASRAFSTMAQLGIIAIDHRDVEILLLDRLKECES